MAMTYQTSASMKEGQRILIKQNDELENRESQTNKQVAKTKPGEDAPGGGATPPAKINAVIKKVLFGGLCTAMLLVAGVAVYEWIQFGSSHEETDDAYITGHLHQVSTRVDGTVEKVWVDDNQHVKQGQVLVTLDSNDYQVKVEQAQANLKQAERQIRVDQTSVDYQRQDARGENTDAEGSVANATAEIKKAEAGVLESQAKILSNQDDLKAKQAEVERAEADWKRYEMLAKEGAVTLSQRDSAKRDYLVATQIRNAAQEDVTQAIHRLQQAQESVNTSKAQLLKAQAEKQLASSRDIQVEVNKAKLDADLQAVEKAKAALKEARLSLSYTRVLAPISGRVGKKTVEEGHRVQPGEPLLTIVSDDPWVVANYKETQLKNMRIGQSVEITVDAIPDHKLKGHVLSFSPASGSSFAILPSDNATGNFTKIVQRLPVKIVLDRDSIKGYEDKLAPGLSVLASVNVNAKPAQSNMIAEMK
jgi:membrane fusion protein (multidrug efflux system)